MWSSRFSDWLNPENIHAGQCRKQIRHVCPQCISLLTLERKQARNWCWTHPGWSPVRGLECIIAKIIYCSALWCKKQKKKKTFCARQPDSDPPQSAWEFNSKIVVFQTNVLTPAREGHDIYIRHPDDVLCWLPPHPAGSNVLSPVCKVANMPLLGLSFLPGTWPFPLRTLPLPAGGGCLLLIDKSFLTQAALLKWESISGLS